MNQGEPPRDERTRRLMMAALDGEITAQDRTELDRLLQADAALETEWLQLARLKEVTSDMALRRPSEEVWDRYWGGVYRRLERGVGWILASLGAVVLISYGLWTGIKSMFGDPELPMFIKVAILAVIVGVVILLISVIREKLFTRQADPYKDVVR
jgi:ferric-dicitrate binding protein FerR (iron transport regulator)